MFFYTIFFFQILFIVMHVKACELKDVHQLKIYFVFVFEKTKVMVMYVLVLQTHLLLCMISREKKISFIPGIQ